MAEAHRRRADIVHFSECALSGYAGSEFQSWRGYPWAALREEAEAVLAEARRLGLWAILGSTHPLTPPHRPHNSLYVISPDGRIVDRYDKRFLTPRDTRYYSAGDHWTIFDLRGVRCAAMICFDLRFPEPYRELKRRGVEMVFQSFYNARVADPTKFVHRHVMRQTAQAQCGFNYFWMSGANSSARHSLYPSFFIRPDGVIARQLPLNRPGLMLNEVDTRREYYDLARECRASVLRGRMHVGRTVRDPRSRARTRL
jgi:predicted amidohydrolase